MIYFSVVVVLLTIFLLTNKRYRWFYIIYKTLGRDLRAAFCFGSLNVQLRRYERNNKTVPKIFQDVAAQHPHKVALYFEDQVWTFQDVENLSNKVANYFKRQGFKRGDSAALLLESRPEYVCIWLGLSKIGVVTALVNYNLVSDPLVHCIKASNARAVILGTNFATVVNDIAEKIPNLKLFALTVDKVQFCDSRGFVDLSKQLENESDASPDADIAKGEPKEKLLFIYTSGTTGLPKAAVITNMRYIFLALALRYMARLTKDDILYNCLPLYHTAGGIVGVGQCTVYGLSVVIRRKFSASNFWSDCSRYKCTVAQYIGEICRYILAAHVNSDEPIPHSVRKIVGNGLRPQIWEQFITKFNIEEVFEFYGATEGNSNLVNTDSTVGAVGFVPRYGRLFYPVTLIKCEEETGEPIRGPDGFYQRCKPGEPGVLVGKVNPKTTVNDFSGYADKEANEKKVIKNVFKKGDRYFNSGDILVQDEFGYYYFKDRTGDTFRWKGENVSTSEVEAIISNVVNLTDAVVYGVEIPGNEGRAGMVALVDTTSSLNMRQLYRGLKDNLPSYAVPIFVRVMNSVPITGTFKIKKIDLQKEAFDVTKIQDKIYMYDAKNATYTELTKDKYDDIISRKIKL